MTAGLPDPTPSSGPAGMPPVMNLGHLLTDTARRFPDRPGLIRGERVWTWAEINRRVDAMAASLRARGIGKGDRILVHCRNSNIL